MSNSNPTAERMKVLANATPAEREAARQAYIKYAAANRALGSAPESFQAYLFEWLSVREIRLADSGESSPYEARDYSPHYRSGER